jgi:AsmA protein
MRLAKTWALGGLCALLALAAGFYPWPIQGERANAALNSLIGPKAGLHWRPHERVLFTLLPGPGLRLVDAQLLDADNRSVLDAPVVQVGLSPARLLRGEFAPASATLTNPTMLIDLDAIGATVAQTLESRPTLARIEIHGGVAKIVSAERSLDTLIENIDGRVEWRDVARPLRFSIAATWRGERVATEGRVDAPLKLRRGEPSGLRISVTTLPADMVFDGTANRADAKFDGNVNADIRSLGTIARWLGFGDSPPLFAKEILIDGKAIGGSGSLALNETRLEINGQTFEGSVNLLRAGDKMSASGTLAASELNMAALLGEPPSFLDTSGHWSRPPVIPEPSDRLDLDLRVSASRATWGGHTVEDAAASLQQRDGRLTLKLLDGTACEGALSGEASIQRSAAGLETMASASLENADIGALLSEWGASSYTGRGALEAKLHAIGASPAELAASLSGTATLELQEGAIAGVNFEEALRRSLRRPVDIPRDMAIGQTKFDSARAQLEILNGQARIVEAQTDGPGAIISAQGVIDIVAREWRTKIHAIQAGALGAPSVDAAQLTLALFGPWASPTIVALTNWD